MKKLMKVYWPFSKAVIQEFMTYRVNFYIYILGELLQTVVLLYIWRAVFMSSSNEVIQGFTFDEMVTYIFMSTITGMLILNDVHWAIGSDVRSGDIAMNLIKPVGYQMRQFASAVGYIIVNVLFIALPLYLAYSIFMAVSQQVYPDPIRLLMYFISSMMSALILFGINYAFGLAAFYVNYIFGFIYAKETVFRFFSGAIIPLAFFPESITAALNILPFGSLLYTPVMIYLGKYEGVTMWVYLGIQLIWVVLLLLLDQFLWSKAIKRLSIMGG